MPNGWVKGKIRNKDGHRVAVNPYFAIVVRASDYSASAPWEVYVAYGNMMDFLSDEDGRPILFARSDLGTAKSAAIAFARKSLQQTSKDLKTTFQED